MAAKILKGRVWTGDPRRPRAEAVAVAGGAIVAVGTLEEARAALPGSEEWDAGGLVVPGLWDAHIHLYYWSLGRLQVQLAGCRSAEEMLQRVAAHAAERPSSGWLLGRGWNETAWSPPLPPDRHALDGVAAPGQPVLLHRSDMHSALANTEALRRAGLLEGAPDVAGGEVVRDGTGAPTGLLRELAVNLVSSRVPSPGGATAEEALARGLEDLHRLGITGLVDQRMKDHDEGPLTLGILARRAREGTLRTRVSCNVAEHDLASLPALEAADGVGGDLLRLGHAKVFSDGTLGSRTARMLEPFEGAGDFRGTWLTPPAELAAAFARAVKAGLPVSVHAIGDEAIRTCLDLLADLPPVPGRPPHRIEHVQIVAPEDVDRLAALGVTASVQPAHALDDMEAADRFLGPRADRAYRFAALRRAGTLLAFGSDAPVADPSPFYGLHGAVIRQRPERRGEPPWQGQERLTLDEALHAYTLGAARASGWEALTGSLEPGKRADLAVLHPDPFEALQGPDPDLAATRAVLTMVDGEVVHRED